MNIGALTHFTFWYKGLGKAAIGALCAWAIENGYIAQHRHDLTNTGSAHMAQSLNFKVYTEKKHFG
jgi:hypothetical protein